MKSLKVFGLWDRCETPGSVESASHGQSYSVACSLVQQASRENDTDSPALVRLHGEQIVFNQQFLHGWQQYCADLNTSSRSDGEEPRLLQAACLNTPEAEENTEGEENSIIEAERLRAQAEHLHLTDQIQMWRAVETLQNRATLGNLTQQRGHCGGEMTTIAEEDSVFDKQSAMDLPSPYQTIPKLSSCRFQSCCSLKFQLDNNNNPVRDPCLSTSETVLLDGLNPGEHF